MRSWWRRVFRRFAILSRLHGPDQWWLFMRVFAFASAVPLLFNLKLRTVSRLLERRIRSTRKRSGDSIKSEQIIRCVGIAMAIGQPLVRPRCLVRAVTLYYFLRRAGMDLTLCFGAAMKQGRLVEAAGHCWLTKDGQPFLEERDPHANFVPIYRLPLPEPGNEPCELKSA